MRQHPLGIFEGVDTDREHIWELFHENSKTSKYMAMPPDEAVVAHMSLLREALSYDQYPVINLPRSVPQLKILIADIIGRRETARALTPCRLTLEQISVLLGFGYGVTRDLREQGFPRTFRTVPSGGALYPLEIYLYSSQTAALETGIYHYNPVEHELSFIEPGDFSERISRALVQGNLAVDAGMIVFITAVFERSVFKYGDRGYRFVLLEAGHVAQNINLAVAGLGLGCVNIGGFFDRDIDYLLGLDGLTHSSIYLLAVGEGRQA